MAVAQCRSHCYGENGTFIPDNRVSCAGCPELRAPSCEGWCHNHEHSETPWNQRCSWDSNACSGCAECKNYKPADQLGTRRLGDPQQVAFFISKDTVRTVCDVGRSSVGAPHDTLYLSQQGNGGGIVFGDSTWLTAPTPATGIRPGHLFEPKGDTLRTKHTAWCRIDPARHTHVDKYTERRDKTSNVEWVVHEIPHYVSSSSATTPVPPSPNFLTEAFAQGEGSNKETTTKIHHVGMLIRPSNKPTCSTKAKLKSCLLTGNHTSNRCLNLVDSNIADLKEHFLDPELRRRAIQFCSVPDNMARSEKAAAEGKSSLCQRIAAQHPADFLGSAVTNYCNNHLRGGDDPFCGCFPRYWEAMLAKKIPDLRDNPVALEVARSAMRKENPRCQLNYCTSDDAYKRNTDVCPSSTTQVCIQKMDAAASAGEVAAIGQTCFGSNGKSPAPTTPKQIADWLKDHQTTIAIISSVAMVVILLLVVVMSRRRSGRIRYYV